MEKNLKIKVSDKYYVYGRLSGTLKKPLVIIVHGLPGSMDESFYTDAARWFSKKGFSVFRFNLYYWPKDARELIDSTLNTHAHDLDAIVRYFRKRGVKKIFAIGHSYGGPTILLSKEQGFDAVVLWDPSYKISFTKKRYGFSGGKYLKEVRGYFMKWGVNVVIGKAMALEADTLAWDELPKNFYKPLKIISAEKGVLAKSAQHYIKNAHLPKSLVVIKDATHYFDDKEDMQEKVFGESARWFKKFSAP